jgi:5,10-methylenetetrahydromethanopterin reductase
MTGPIAVEVSRSGTAAQWRDRMAAAAEAGTTEVAFQPAGDDLRRELRAFIEATNG